MHVYNGVLTFLGSCVLCFCKGQAHCSVIVFVFILPEKAIPEMTYTVSGGTLNPTHSLTESSLNEG